MMVIDEECLLDIVALSKRQCKSPIVCQLAYATQENFIGRIVDGYSPGVVDLCLMARKAGHALCEVQNYLIQSKQLGLFVFDGYRPLRAVKDFAAWFHSPVANDYELVRKKIHYPNIEKTEFERLGYVAGDVSRHNFGFAIDLTLIDLSTHDLLNMGACFDYFDPISHADVTADVIGVAAYQNRQILSEAMQKFGFKPYEYEYWHFDYELQEVDHPMDIVIDSKLKGLGV